jgi:hypothetical protein
MTPEQKKYYEKEIWKIRNGGSRHEAFMLDHVRGNLGPLTPPVVLFGQDDDPHYAQYLQNWDEVEALIAQLREEATKAWGATPPAAQPEQERNFCSRCGKRTADLTVIHTCTPPQENT